MWRPPLSQTVPASSGNVWNKTLSGVPVTATAAGIDRENQVLLLATNMAVLGYTPYPTPKNFSFSAISLKKGEEGKLLWRQDRPWPSGNLTLEMGSVGSGVYTVFVKETLQLYGYSTLTGTQIWGPTSPAGPWDMYGLGGAIAYGKLFSCGWGGVLYCRNITTGTLLWNYTAKGIGSEPFYGNYPLNIGVIADHKIYLLSSEHSPTKPFWRGSSVRCVDTNNGNELWKIDCWAGAGFGAGLAIADGYLIAHNCYDNQIYCFGKGQTATTVSTSPKVVANGSSIIIEGTVLDQSPGAKGTPAMSDTSMTAWMRYLYMQQPCPADATGVPVKLEAFGADGSYVEIGTVTSDAYGNFKCAWTPPKQILYTIMATFAGSDSYWSSYAATGLSVVPAPAPVEIPEVEVPAYPDYTPMFAGIIVAIVAVAILVVYSIFRKRP
jgi:outer membrane protein assembly factor BamB